MSLTLNVKNKYQLFHRSRPLARRALATAASDLAKDASSSPVAGPSDPKISRIVDDIAGLTLLQAADLVSSLKVCTKIIRLKILH